jgi:hypothetical protein
VRRARSPSLGPGDRVHAATPHPRDGRGADAIAHPQRSFAARLRTVPSFASFDSDVTANARAMRARMWRASTDRDVRDEVVARKGDAWVGMESSSSASPVRWRR